MQRNPVNGVSCRLQHIGFVVEDLAPAAAHFAATYGVGWFLTVPHLEFDELRFRGEPCRWEHSLAFAEWGELQIELQTAHAIEPPELNAMIGQGASAHVSYRVADLSEETSRLEQRGRECFFYAHVGPVEFLFFQDHQLPSYIEVHKDNPFLHEFDEAIAAATRDWDGGEPLLALETPPGQ